ncbi:glutamine--fructose-6-phosphate transaminase (isomerizing) [Patescibacteria group bacterium]|nr:glutamine--fructose-6-phosphate transaminase (isomerizing) [Patescibacteria group bacterium]
MCGIFGYIGVRKDAKDIVLNGLKALEYRGYDSWGVATIDQRISGKEIAIKKKVGKIGNATVSDLPESGMALGHTRWATHGGVSDINAHPHLDCSGKLAIIHNGIIENYDELKKEIIKSGHKLISETDTEVAIHMIEENYKKIGLLEAVRQAFNRFEGLNAIIVMDGLTQTFVAAKSGSPLVIGKGKDENFLASDAHAILPYTNRIYFIEDGEIVSVSSRKISVHSTKDGSQKEVKFNKVGWDINIADKGKFPYFMLKEIFEQPKVIEDIVNNNEKQIEQFSDLIKKSYGTYLIGSGTASYACLAGTYIFSRIAKKHINWAAASEFGYSADFLTPKSFVIALSQSGETIDVIDAVKKAKSHGVKIGALVNVLGSTLYRLSDYKLLLGAGVEKAVVSTKAFSAKLTYLILLASIIAGNKNKAKKELDKVIISLEEILSDAYLIKIKKLVDIIYKFRDIYVIGRGLSYPIALETALKIKEASYIHAEGFAAGELKHGVIALIENGIPCIAFLPNDETYGANLAGAMEMKARGGYIIGISYKPHEVFDYYLPVRDCGLSSIIPLVIVGQLLGYYLSIKRGLDPDKPRNLAKSVTVK